MERKEIVFFSSEVELSDGMVYLIDKPKVYFIKNNSNSLLSDSNDGMWVDLEILLYSNSTTDNIIHDLIKKHGNKRGNIFSVEIVYDNYDNGGGIWAFDVVKLKYIDFGSHVKNQEDNDMLIRMIVGVDNCKFYKTE